MHRRHPARVAAARTVAALRKQQRWGSMRNKIVSLRDAVSWVHTGDTVGVGGFLAMNSPEALLRGLGEHYAESRSPADLTLMFGGGPGDRDQLGLNHFGQKGMVKRAIGSHYFNCPKLAQLVKDNEVEGYNLPLGSTSRMMREAARHGPGFITTVGVNTYLDPATGTGGKLNSITTEDLIVPVEIEGKRYLMYKPIPLNVALIRGTTADANGNISMEREGLVADDFVMAMAAKNSGGIVIVQVEHIAATNSIPSRRVHIPGAFVDAVVVAEKHEHRQSYFSTYNPSWSGEIRLPTEEITPAPLSLYKIVARRAAFELRADDMVNVGKGSYPNALASVASEEKIMDRLTTSTEPGVIGGTGAAGKNFGPASNFEAIVSLDKLFDFYTGGGLDVAFLGFAQVNEKGDVNVSRFGDRIAGPGGFPEISHATPTVVYMGSFTTDGLEVALEKQRFPGTNALRIVKEGATSKFTKSLLETSFCGQDAMARHQHVLFVTERCVFKLEPGGLRLTEVAPGIDVEKDILAHMEFRPTGLDTYKMMDVRIFDPLGAPIGFREQLSAHNLEKRISYIAKTNTLLIDFSDMCVNTEDELHEVNATLRKKFSEIGHKCHVVVNYDRFDCSESVLPTWQKMAKALESEAYLSLKRCADATFMHESFLNGLAISNESTRDLFNKLDGGSGYITAAQCKELFQSVGRVVSCHDDELESVIACIDLHKTGKLSYENIEQISRQMNRHVLGCRK
eukprot:Rhum_TRINITY_DN7620_c0_g10::Rhum_TRINITY_DN7620_c0_g10_i1::g.24011::m.24011/K01026/pct; propionate CoA-transferase